MKNLIPGTYNQGKTGKKLNLYARRFDTFEFEFEYKYYNSEGILVTAELTSDVVVQAQIKKSTKHTEKPLRYIPVYLDRTNNKIKLMFAPKENDLVEGKYYYDVEIYFQGKNFTYLSGQFIVLPQVTDWKDWYKLDYINDLQSSVSYEIIHPVNLYNTSISSSVSYDIAEPIKYTGSLNSNISYEFINMVQSNISAGLNSSIAFELIPVIVSYTVMLGSSVDYLRDIAQETGASLTSKIEYEIF